MQVPALVVPAPSPPAGPADRSTALRLCLSEALQALVAAAGLDVVEVTHPWVLDGPVTATGPSPAGDPVPVETRGDDVLRRMALPATGGFPAGEFRFGGPGGREALGAARGFAVLLSCLLDRECARLVAEAAAASALGLANRDSLTGLGNRRAWADALRVEANRSVRHGRPLTVAVLDLDGLKTTNDTDGHAAGDTLITRTAGVLIGVCRSTDVVCRVGGDEFGLAAPDTGADRAGVLAGRVRAGLDLAGVSASIGWAVSAPGTDHHDVTPQILWQQADAAMYLDKRARRARRAGP